MDSSPTVLATAPPKASADPAAAKFPVFPVLLAVAGSVLVATLSAGGGMYYLARSGRLPGAVTTPRRDDSSTPATSHIVLLEPLLINLADAGGTSYARISLALRVADPTNKAERAKEDKGKEGNLQPETVVPVRDTLLTVLGKQTADGLLAPQGKDHLRALIKAELAVRDPELKVKDVYLTDLLIQR